VNAGSTARLGDILNDWKDDYVQLRLIGQTNGRGPLHDEATGEDYEDYKVRIDFRPFQWIPDRLTLFRSGTAVADANLWIGG
jgi:hypothetical protein